MFILHTYIYTQNAWGFYIINYVILHNCIVINSIAVIYCGLFAIYSLYNEINLQLEISYVFMNSFLHVYKPVSSDLF